MSVFFRFILFICCFNVASAQQVGVFQWQEYLPYNKGLSVAEGNGVVYCITENGIFNFNIGDNSINRMSKVNGLSDVEGTIVRFNKNVNKAIIIYKNSNIDIIDNGSVVNIPDIKNKNIIGNKSINNVYILNQYAYLACGFGIVVLDMSRFEIKDTYIFGPNATSIKVNEVTTDNINIYAATDIGIYKASLNSSNLLDYNNWSRLTGMIPGNYNCIANVNGTLFTNLSLTAQNMDTIYYFQNNTWNVFNPMNGLTNYSIINSMGLFTICSIYGVYIYDSSSLTQLNIIYNYNGMPANPKEAIFDNSYRLWIADSNYSLINYSQNNSRIIQPNGPSNILMYDMSINGNNLIIAPGLLSDNLSGSYNPQTSQLNYYTQNNWTTIKGNFPGVVNMDTVFDFVNAIIDSNDPSVAYASSWTSGVLELHNGVPFKLHNKSNSSLRPILNPFVRITSTYGLAVDQNKNLWVCNPGNLSPLSVKRTNGTWSSIEMGNFLGNSLDLGNMIIDKNDQKWIIINRSGGLVVYKGGTTASASNANCKKLTTSAGSGKLPSTNVVCITEDLKGQIWIGTDKGVAVFYSPENVFTNQNYDAQQILLEQDGYVQILLETELVQCIAVDDANRKWIGTYNSGLYLMSADGTKQIYHFTETNSPLFSNEIRSIKINHKTGEVFIGTSKGLLSFRGSSIEANEDFTDVYAFPNPVNHDYTGPIAIKGLVDNTTLKITDVLGQLVYETISEGGQAIWYGKNFKGERVKTGIYIVFCTSEDGSQKATTKIMVAN